MMPKHHARKEVGTKHISLRIPSDVITALESDSVHHGISINALASGILAKWSRWDRHTQSLGMILIPTELIPMLVEGNDEKNIHSVVDGILPFFQDAVVLIKGKYGLKQCIETLEDYMQTMNITSAHTVEGTAHCFIIRHKLGIYWSMFIKILLGKLFVEFVPDRKIEYAMEENIVSVRASLGSDWDEHDY